jgi:cellulose synthase/poly-beta-1,6-N-acetylglucosamine synthase-like glycosyltransferase
MTGYVWFISGFFIAFVTVHSLVLVMAAVELHRYTAGLNVSRLRRMLRSPLAPRISILVPAYNEAKGIVDNVRSLVALDYPQLEVIVINDGSTDDTVQQLVDGFGLRQVLRPMPPYLSCQPVHAVYAPRSQLRLLVVDKENGGKADSLTAGINFASYPLYCSVDADSILNQDALAKTARPFIEDPYRTVATGGLVRVANGCRVEHGRVAQARLPRPGLAMFQVVEYARAFFGARTGWSALNGLLIISGTFGLFKREAVIAAGGYRTDTVGEDMELVTRLHRTCRDAGRPYRIVYVADPVCWTEVPDTARFLRRQRRRWYRGCVEMMLIHRRMILNPRYRAAGLLSLPATLAVEVFGPVIELTGYVVTLVAVILGILSTATFLLFLALAVLYGLILTLGAIAIEEAGANEFPGWDDLRRVLAYAVAENFGYRQVQHVWRLEGIWQLIRGSGWGAMEHKGFAPPP